MSVEQLQHDADHTEATRWIDPSDGTVMSAKEKKRRSNADKTEEAPYTTKIIKAGALLADTKTLLAHWDLDSSVQDNLQRIQHENIFGKASRSRVEDILRIFRQRYLTEEAVTRALVVLVKNRFPASALDRILYFHSARSDRLLFDFVVEILRSRFAQGLTDIDPSDVQHALSKWVQEGKTTSDWGENTLSRVTRNLLASLRDFGVLDGKAKKRIAPAILPTTAFAYIMFFLKQHQSSGTKLINLPDWGLFFLPPEGVERFLFEAHQSNLLEYHAAGTVTRLTFPADTLEEYANVLAERTY